MALRMQLLVRNAVNLGSRDYSWTKVSTCRTSLKLPQVRSVFSATHPLFEKRTIKVPTMGDSITEGTIVEWTAVVGQAVKEGDVIALVETDKVTVDIKAEVDGVIVKQFGAVDDTVEVGAKLYEIDTDAVATTIPEAKTEIDSSPSVGVSAIETLAVVSTEAPEGLSSDHRTPSIHFLGKEGWANRLHGQDKQPAIQPTTSPAASPKASPSRLAVVTADGSNIHPMYGRPAFSEKEMEDLILGGAITAPSVVSHSSGARFLG